MSKCEENLITNQTERVQKSKLFSPSNSDDTKSTQIPIVYHENYDISFCRLEKLHPFDAGKWGRVVKFLKDEKFIKQTQLMKPYEATEDDLLVVHSKEYLDSLRWSINVAKVMELPFLACVPNFILQRMALRNFRYQTGGTVLAAKQSLSHRSVVHIGGGFHHCSAGEGGGFCAYADISLAIQFLQLGNLIKRAMIVDCDAHQGNGHERDFMNDSSVYIIDMFNPRIYPFDHKAKRAISSLIELPVDCSSTQYMALLKHHLPQAIEVAKPDIVIYNAGTDCMRGDPLGCLDVDEEGIIARDAFVFRECRNKNIPIVMLTSGGYQRSNARVIADSIINLSKEGLLDVA